MTELLAKIEEWIEGIVVKVLNKFVDDQLDHPSFVGMVHDMVVKEVEAEGVRLRIALAKDPDFIEQVLKNGNVDSFDINDNRDVIEDWIRDILRYVNIDINASLDV